MEGQTSSFYEFGSFRIDRRERLLLHDGEPVPLPPKVYDTLLALVMHSGHIVAKEELMKAVWPDTFVEEANLTVNVSALRKVLGEGDSEHHYIETVPRRGYRFVLPVTEVKKDSADTFADDTAPSGTRGGQAAVETAHQSAVVTGKASGARPTSTAEYIVGRINQHKLAFALVSTLLMVLAAVGFGYWFSGRRPAGTTQIESIAVLPFSNASGNDDVEYLADGMTESLINSLSQLPNVRVLARSTMFRFKGRDTDPQKVGQQLGVDAVLTGRVVQRGDSLTVQADLVNVFDGAQMWGERYNRRLTNVLAVQEEIVRDVSQKLRLLLSAADKQRVMKGYTENAEAYQVYLKGRFYWNKRTEEGIRKGIGFFEQAIDKDPNFALAYVGLADSYTLLGISDALTAAASPQETIPKARAAAERALEIDNSLGEAHASLAHVKWTDRDWSGAEAEFERSFELNPNYSTAHHWHALYLANLGRLEEALTEIKRAQELDPLSLPINSNLAFIFYSGRRYDEAIEQCKKTLDMDSTFVLARQTLGLVYVQKGMYPEAIAEFQQAIVYSNQRPTVVASLAHAYAMSGNKGEARKVLGELTHLAGRRYVPSNAIAIVYVGLGEREQAFRWLERAVEQRDWLSRLKIDPRLDPLHSDPRFADLLRRVGFPQ